MNRFKKIIITTSIALNAVFFILLISMLFKLAYYKGRGYFDDLGDSSKNYEEREYKQDDDDDDDDDDDEDYYQGNRPHSRGRELARGFARDIAANPELRKSFHRLGRIHQQLLEVCREENYDEEKIRELFVELETAFITNKNIVLEELLVRMRDMESRDRVLLISSFFRMPSSTKLMPRK